MKSQHNRNYATIVNTEYVKQITAIQEICNELNLIAYFPDYHAKFPDCNTILIYTKENHDYNLQLEKHWKKYRVYPLESEYKPYITYLENTDINGCFNLLFMNHGKLDLRWANYKEVIKNYIISCIK